MTFTDDLRLVLGSADEAIRRRNPEDAEGKAALARVRDRFSRWLQLAEGQGLRKGEAPVRSEGGLHNRYREDHPAYAMIGASRVSASPGRALFGSDFRHQHYVVIQLHPAARTRSDISSDWYHAERLPIVEVALSEAQWATFVSAMNIGNGVPATLQSVDGVPVPGIEPVENRRQEFNAEVGDRLAAAIEAVTAIRDAAPNKKVRDAADTALRRLTDSLPWVAKQFDEHVEQTVEKAKMEVNAYATHTLVGLGLASLAGGETPFLQLAEPEEPDREEPRDWEGEALASQEADLDVRSQDQ